MEKLDQRASRQQRSGLTKIRHAPVACLAASPQTGGWPIRGRQRNGQIGEAACAAEQPQKQHDTNTGLSLNHVKISQGEMDNENWRYNLVTTIRCVHRDKHYFSPEE